MLAFSPSIKTLVAELKKLPGIGPKSAQRICFWLLKHRDEGYGLDLSQALSKALGEAKICSLCHNISDDDPCNFCSDILRERTKLCVVEEPFNIYAIERSSLYKGLYHVLGGNLSPLNGVGPEELNLNSLVKRVSSQEIEEVIIATSPTTEGSATAHYIVELLKGHRNLKISRIALGLPLGADIDYVDSLTIAQAIEARTII